MKKIIIIPMMAILLSFISYAWFTPVAYYKFDGNSSDITGYRDLTNVNNPAYVTGKIGQAINFSSDDGTDDMYAYNLDGFNGEQDGIRTIDCWVYIRQQQPATTLKTVWTFLDDPWNSYRTYFGINWANNGMVLGSWQVGEIEEFGYSIIPDAWHHYVFVMDGAINKLYYDSILNLSWGNAGTIGSGANLFKIGERQDHTGNFNGMVDNCFITNGTYSQQNVTASYNSGNGMDFFPSEAPPPPGLSIVFLTQTPADLNSTNAFNARLNITYLINNSNNASSQYLEYKTNNSDGNVNLYISNVVYPPPFFANPSSNISNIFTFLLSDNQIYPATYNYNQSLIVTAGKTDSLVSGNNILRNTHYNIQNRQYSFLELYAVPVGIPDLTVYFCNSSYVTGNVAVNANCVNFYTLSHLASYDHTHNANSSHYIIPMPVVNNQINGIGITNPSYMVYVSSGAGWNLKYSALYDSAAIETSANNGNSYSALPGTLDSHIHFFSDSDFFNYRACAEGQCSSWRSDLLQLSGIPPSSPTITYPNGGNFAGTIPITYLASTSPNGYNITSYLIELYDLNLVYVNEIKLNNYPNLTYNWDTTQSYLTSTNFSLITTAFYKFEEGAGTIAYDSQDSNNLNNTGTYLYAASKGGNATGNYAIKYNGVNSYSKAGNSNKLKLSNSSTIAMWIKPNISTANTAFASKSTGISTEYWFGSSNLNPYFAFRTNQNTSQAFTSTLTLTNNSWQFVALTINKTATTNFLYKFYLNDNLNTTTTSTVGLLNADQGTGEFNVGRESFNQAYYSNSVIDNVLIFNRTLGREEIIQLYNYSIYSPQRIADGSYHLKVSATDALGSSSFDFSEAFNIDNTPPVITLINPPPSYNETYGYNANITINFSVTEFVNCVLNDSSFYLTSSNGSIFNYLASSNLSEGFHAVNITCRDLTLSQDQKTAYFTKDINFPNILVFNPANNSILDPLKSNIRINVSFLDDRDLYDYQLNISYIDPATELKVIVYNITGIISGYSYYNLSFIIASSLIPNNTGMQMDIRTCDSHTDAFIDEATGILQTANSLSYQFKETDIKVTSSSGSEINAKTEKLLDRYTFEFSYEKAESKVFYLESNKQIIYLPNSPYPAHFVIDGHYWVDFAEASGKENKAFVTLEEDGRYKIEIDDESLELKFNSIGELNCIQKIIYFSKQSTETGYGNYILKGTNWFNQDATDVSTTAGVMVIFFLLFVWVCLIVLTEVSRIPIMGVLNSVYGFFLGYLFFSLISVVMGVVFIVINLIYIMRCIIMAWTK